LAGAGATVLVTYRRSEAGAHAVADRIASRGGRALVARADLGSRAACDALVAEAREQLGGLDVLFLDALRHKPHPTHSTVERSMAYAELLNPRRTYFTHICHELPHARTESGLPPHIRLAYDGLEITVGDPL